MILGDIDEEVGRDRTAETERTRNGKCMEDQLKKQNIYKQRVREAAWKGEKRQ